MRAFKGWCSCKYLSISTLRIDVVSVLRQSLMSALILLAESDFGVRKVCQRPCDECVKKLGE